LIDMTAPHYAEAFSPLLTVHHSDRSGGPIHCPEPRVWRGSWQAPNGCSYRVEADGIGQSGELRHRLCQPSGMYSAVMIASSISAIQNSTHQT
jgi:hypothetical protein